MNFDELHSSLYALQKAFGEAGSARMKQVELEILNVMREGGAKTKTASILAERAWFLDNSFKGNKDA